MLGERKVVSDDVAEEMTEEHEGVGFMEAGEVDEYVRFRPLYVTPLGDSPYIVGVVGFDGVAGVKPVCLKTLVGAPHLTGLYITRRHEESRIC